VQNQKCNLIKSNLEELIESQTAFENILNILNNELIMLDKQMEQEREADKAIIRGCASEKKSGKSMFTNLIKKSNLFLFFNLFLFINFFVVYFNRESRISWESRIWIQEKQGNFLFFF